MGLISKIELDLGGKKVTLTPKQAQNLKKALDELFGKQVVREEHHHHDWLPWLWTYPNYSYTWEPAPLYPYTVSATDSAGNYNTPAVGISASYDSGTLRLTG
jgi:hypothetical protein